MVARPSNIFLLQICQFEHFDPVYVQKKGYHPTALPREEMYDFFHSQILSQNESIFFRIIWCFFNLLIFLSVYIFHLESVWWFSGFFPSLTEFFLYCPSCVFIIRFPSFTGPPVTRPSVGGRIGTQMSKMDCWHHGGSGRAVGASTGKGGWREPDSLRVQNRVGCSGWVGRRPPPLPPTHRFPESPVLQRRCRY